MKPTLRALLALSVLTACAQAPAPRAAPAAASSADTIVASIDGLPVRRGDLDPAIEKELESIRNESEQRRFHLLWVGTEEAIAKALIEREAGRRALTVEQLRKQEVVGKVVMPSDEEVRKVYDDNVEVIRAPYDAAAPLIKRQMLGERGSDLERALVARLRADADVRSAVPVPDLPRFEVSAGSSPARGPKDAKVTLIEFSDFECPYCARAKRTAEQLLERYPDSLRVVFRDFPLSQHKNARPAAEAAQCAHEQGKFWPYHDLLFENARALSSDDLKRYADEVGLEREAFESCLASERPKKAVAASEAAAREYGVGGTPALFINGIKLVGLLPLPLMQIIIDNELSR